MRVESNHSGMGKPINFHYVSPLHLQGMAGEGLAVSGTGGKGRRRRKGEGGEREGGAGVGGGLR